MFNYDIYKNRIQRLATIKRLIVRFRVPIILFAVLLVAGLGSFLGTKGMVTTNVSLAAKEIRYGDTYELVDARALMSSIRGYEFSEIGTNVWTTDKPKYPGKYYVRAVTSGGFGKRRGASVAFEILPRQVDFIIHDESIVYGDVPTEIELQLIGSDTLVKGDLKFNFADFTDEQTDVTVDVSSIHIDNGAGKNVTAYYEISTAAQNVRLRNKRLTVVPFMADSVYNGAPQAFAGGVSDNTATALNGDTITFESVITDANGAAVSAPQNAGSYTVAVKEETVRIFNNGADVTARYELRFAPSTFNIARKPLGITTATATKVYDGLPLADGTFTAVTGIDGHVVASNAQPVSVIDAKTVDNRMPAESFIVTDANGMVVTDNYEIHTTYGQLTVEPFTIAVTTATDDSFVYDGGWHSNDRFDMHGTVLPVADHTLTSIVTGDSRIREAGSTQNRLDFTVLSKAGDVTGNYKIVPEYGTLTVRKRRLTVTTNTTEKVYDGAPLADFYGTISEDCDGLAPDQELGLNTANSVVPYETITEVGSVTNYVRYGVYRGRNDYSANYEITVVPGTLTVTHRRIRAVAASDTRVYDGTSWTLPQASADWIYMSETGTEIIPGAGLVWGHTCMVADKSKYVSIRNVGSVVNLYAPADYAIYDRQGTSVTHNYIIESVAPGLLQVNERPVIITTATDDKIYDGTALTAPTATADDLASGHWLEAVRDTIVSIDEYTKTPVQNRTQFVIRDADGADVTANYAVTERYGTLRIDQRTTTVTTASDARTYNGQPLSAYEGYAADNLAAGQSLRHTVTPDKAVSITNYGSKLNAYTFVVYGNGKDVTHNYILNYAYGTLTITSKTITVETFGGAKEYDADPLMKRESGDWRAIGLENDGAYIVLDERRENEFGTITDVGETPNKLYFRVKDKDGNDNNNYSIDEQTSVYGMLTVTARLLVLRPDDGAHTYDAQDFSVQTASVTDGSLVKKYNHTLRAVESTVTKIKVCAQSGTENKTQFAVFVGDTTTEVTHNYAISYSGHGILTVNRRPMTITTGSAKKEYDGDPLSVPEIFTANNLVSGPTVTHSIEADLKTVKTIIDFGSTPNTTKYIIREAGIPVTENYDITYIEGTLSITKRKVVIVTDSAEKIYDGTPLSVETAIVYHIDNSTGAVDALSVKPGLVKSQTITRKTDSPVQSITDVGTKTNVYAYDFYDGSRPVNDNYDPLYTYTDPLAGQTYTYGNLTITHRPIWIRTRTDSFEYDGREHWIDFVNLDEDIIVQGEYLPIVSGQTVKVLNPARVRDVKEGAVTNTADFEIWIGASEKVTSNYAIKSEYGTIRIYARAIRVTTNSSSHEYNGRFYSDDGRTVTYEGTKPGSAPLVDGHDLSLVGTAKTVMHTWDTTAENNTNRYIVVADGVDVSSNYKIEHTFGTLTVTPRPIYITTFDKKKEYDDLWLNAIEPASVKNLVEDEDLKQSLQLLRANTIRDVGRVENEVLYKVYDEILNIYVTDDYEFHYTYGWLEITAKSVTITTGSAEKIYDAIALRADFDKMIAGSETDGYTSYSSAAQVGLITDHWLIVDALKSVTDYNGEETKNNTTTYKVYAPPRDGDDINNADGGIRDVTKNYTIHYEYGTLTVTKRPIRLLPASHTWVYDGQPHYDDSALDFYLTKLPSGAIAPDPTKKGLMLDHRAVAQSAKVTVTNVWDSCCDGMHTDGCYGNNHYKYVIHNAAGQDVTDNYNVDNIARGHLSITPKDITVTRLSQTKVYDGLPLYGDQAASDGLVSSTHKLAAVDSAEQPITQAVNVWDTPKHIVTLFTVVCNDVPRIHENYTIHYADDVSGSLLTIMKRPIVIATADGYKVYDGAELIARDPSDYWADDLVYNTEYGLEHVLRLSADPELIAKFGTITNAGDTKNELYFDIFDQDGVNVLRNYHITRYDYGILHVERRPLYIRLSDDFIQPLPDDTGEFIYNGDLFTYADGNDNYYTIDAPTDVFEYGLINGERLTAAVIFMQGNRMTDAMHAGTYEIILDELSCRIDGGNALVANYRIECQSGTLIIKARTVYIKIKDTSYTYDGPHPVDSEGRYDLNYLYQDVEGAVYEPWGDAVGNSAFWFAIVKGQQEEIGITVDCRDEQGISRLPINAGTYYMTILPEQCRIENGNLRIENYDLQCQPGAVTILPRSVTVDWTDPITTTYNKSSVDATPYVKTYRTDRPAEFGIVPSEWMTEIMPVFEYYDAADNPIVNRDGDPVAPVNAGTYSVRVARLAGDPDALKNYVLDADGSARNAIEIRRKAITLEPITGRSKAYDGQPVTYRDIVGTGAAYYATGLETGDVLDVYATFTGSPTCTEDSCIAVGVTDSASVVDAAVYTINFDREYFENNNPNYSIGTLYAGTYTIGKLTVEVSNSDWSDTYTGRPLYAPDEISSDNVSAEYRQMIADLGHKIVAAGERFSVIEAGTYRNEQSIRIVDAAGDECMHNYNVVFIKGTVTVRQRKLTISTNIEDPIRTYTGLPFAIAFKECTFDGLADIDDADGRLKHVVRRMTWEQMVRVGIYTQYELAKQDDKYLIEIYDSITNTKVGSNGKPLADNYEIRFGDRTVVQITPKQLTFGDYGVTVRTYNGLEQPLTIEECLGVALGDAPETFSIVKYEARNEYGDTVLKNAGTYTVTVRKEDILLDGKSALSEDSNYTLLGPETVTFTVKIDLYNLKDKGIAIKTASAERPYDGNVLISNRVYYAIDEADVYYEALPTGDRLSFVAEIGDRIREPDASKTNDLQFVILDNANQDVTRCYEFDLSDPAVYQPGTLHVSPYVRLQFYKQDASVLYDGELHSVVKGSTSDGREGYKQTMSLTFTADPSSVYRLTDGAWIAQADNAVRDAGSYRIGFSAVRFSLYGQELKPETANALIIVNDKDEEGNYLCEREVRRRVLYARPSDVVAPYVGVNTLQHGSQDFVLFDLLEYVADEADDMVQSGVYRKSDGLVNTEGNAHRFILNGTNGALDVTAGRVRMNVNLTASRVLAGDGTDVTHNYLIYTSFDESVMPREMRSAFIGKLQFTKRTVEIVPLKVSDYVYDGAVHALPIVGNGENLFEYVADGYGDPYGLLTEHGHFIRVVRAEATPLPGTKKSWLTAKIYAVIDGEEVDVSAGYTIRKTYDDERSAITVAKASLKIESGSATAVAGSGTLTCDTVTVTLNGRVLTKNADGLYELYDRQLLRVNVVGSIAQPGWVVNDFTYSIFRKAGDKEQDTSKYYDVERVLGRLTLT